MHNELISVHFVSYNQYSYYCMLIDICEYSGYSLLYIKYCIMIFTYR